MDVNERIKNVGKYFAMFNVHDGVVCVGVRFPDKWTLFDIQTICDEFNIQIKSKDGVAFFLCDINDGFDPVFDAVDFIIEQNKSLEEKTNLLKQKVEELRILFEQESLDKLKTLQFVFDGYKDDTDEETFNQVDEVTLPVNIKQQLRKSNKKTETQRESEDKNIITVQESDRIVVDKPVKTPKSGKRKNNPGDSSLMNFVKDTLDNE
jgi:hypothetical protein